VQERVDYILELEEAYAKIKHLEDVIYDFVVSEGYYIPEGLEYLFIEE
jgi:hypothetical protein